MEIIGNIIAGAVIAGWLAFLVANAATSTRPDPGPERIQRRHLDALRRVTTRVHEK